jgi:hypothetical protein
MKKGIGPARIKQQIVDRYLGTVGIHGIGVVRAGRALRVYCEPGESVERQAVLDRLKRDAEPLEVEIVAKAPPRAG